MSLGAIDFGLIVDGAVIIVEAIVHRLQSKPASNKLSVAEMDTEIYQAASGIRKSAAFGEIIILIVYLPILALVGIEGKMFAPMAQTVSFAILGAFILSLTYVPMMSALFLSKKMGHKKNLSDRIIGMFQSLYTPVLKWAMKLKLLVIALSVALFVMSLFLFDSLGGEFIPTLSEGDIATHVIIPPGSSLQQEIHSTTKAEQLLLANFPEIEQIVSKIGASEVATDPMPMEVADVLVILKDKKEWTSASSKQEMFDKMEKVLDELPGVTTEFSQPIQMRFNELMTGIRSDVGIKIFGEDIELLVALGEQVEGILKNVAGVQDARAETVSGLPQINIKYNKDKLALYGLNVSDLNQAVSMGFAGSPAGVIYEGEKKYNLVVRLDEEYRQDISNIENLYVSLPSGNQIPLGQVADIKLERGPAQISREDGKRRIIVGFNVRNRDVESVVDEIQLLLTDRINLPVGYYIQYAGQFENLKRAKSRLGVAVPIALVLIFVLLYFTFESIMQSLLIFTAIPLSAIGGVIALWVRDMPFSISAGIGFIALFGVAVLNGIVLIGYFNQLKKEGMTDIMQRIKVGTTVRLRPVIMTASVASLGFLPMALSNSAGAEVQKPLATVVIGGLITATILTLIILPVLYYYIEKFKNRRVVIPTNLILVGIISIFSFSLSSQTSKISTLDQAIEIAITNNGNLKAGILDITRNTQIKEGAYKLPKTEIGLSLGQMNTRLIDQSYSISQNFNPYLSKVKRALAEATVTKSEIEYDLSLSQVKYQLRERWDKINYHSAVRMLLAQQNDIWEQFSIYAEKKYQVGESNILESATGHARLQSIVQEIKREDAQIEINKLMIQSIINTTTSVEPDRNDYKVSEWKQLFDSTLVLRHPLIKKAIQEIELSKGLTEVYAAEKKPDFTIGYFLQSIRGTQNINNEVINYNALPRFQGVNLGMSIPLFGKGYNAEIQASKTSVIIQEAKVEQLEKELLTQLKSLINQFYLNLDQLDYFTSIALPNADLIETSASSSYENGEIGYMEYIQSLNTQYEIKKTYLNTIQQYNQSVNAIKYLLNQ